MYDREAFEVVATDIAQWQSDALTLPLPDLSAMTAIWQKSLIESLNDFNASYACHHGGDDPSDEFRYAIGEVARRATAMAIFALAAAQRLHMAAHQN